MAKAENSEGKKPAIEIEKKADKAPKAGDTSYLPPLLEFSFSFSSVFVVIVFLVIITSLLLNGANPLDMVIRTGVSLLVLGGLLVLINRQIIFGFSNPQSNKPNDSKTNPENETQSPSEVK